jgi:hypothetical protein
MLIFFFIWKIRRKWSFVNLAPDIQSNYRKSTKQVRATSDIFEFQIKQKFKTQNRTEKIFFSFGPVP